MAGEISNLVHGNKKGGLVLMWEDAGTVVSLVLASVGGIGTIICVFVKFAVNTIAECLQKKYDVKLNKDLEKYIANLDKKSI